MAKKFKAPDAKMKPDPRYKSPLAAKFINCMMERGKKTVAQRIFYDALAGLQKRLQNVDPYEAFNKAIENVKPVLEVRSRRVGGANYQVPREVPIKRQRSLAIRWILNAIRGKKGKPLAIRLADELANAFKGEGDAMKKREEVHKMAEANKAFAHFQW